jgi:excisionase family DNA binding protein
MEPDMTQQSELQRNVDTPAVLTVAEACLTLRISKWSLYQLIRSRQLETIRIGRRRLIPVAAIQALIQQLGREDAA